MKYRVIKLHFQSSVHFGDGLLESAKLNPTADTLFSAICHEALSQEGIAGIDFLVDSVRDGLLKISDAFPFINQMMLLPKPAEMIRSSDISDTDDSSAKKMFKKLHYLPLQELKKFLAGSMSQDECKKDLELIHTLGKSFLKTNVRIYDGMDKDADPYYVGGFRFAEGCGLWFLVCTENEQIMQKCIELIHSLGYSGLGGKRSSGYGRFIAEAEEPEPELTAMLEGKAERYMTLSVALPKEDELEAAIEDASCVVMQRTGFVGSDTFADCPQKKRDMYLFSSGSCFSHVFAGDVYDVSDGGNHPVYRYAVPLMLRVR